MEITGPLKPENVREMTQRWMEANPRTIQTARDQIALFIDLGITSAIPFNYFALLAQCVLGEPDPKTNARLVLETLNNTKAGPGTR